jgi:hypothetical protein
MEPLASIEKAPFMTKQQIDFAGQVARSMVCYFQKEVRPINSQSLKEAKQEKAGKAQVKVEVLSKEVNHILNCSGDAFLLQKYQKFRKQV